MSARNAKLSGIAWQIAAYSLAVLVAVGVFQMYTEHNLFWRLLVADIAATLVIFVFSRISKNSSFYDPYWSLQPVVIAVGLYFMSWSAQPFSRQEVVLTMIILYGLRLTYNFLRTWPGLEHQDWRYDDLRKKHGSAYWLVSFGGIHFFPTLLVYGGCLSLIVIYAYPDHFWNWLDIVGLLILSAGIWLEHTADQQLFAFKRASPPRGSLLDSGLWSEFRHPNYLGEIMVWWGLYFFALAANPAFWWVIVGPLSIHLLFVFISIPMKDERMINSRPAYAERMKTVPALWPKSLRR